MNTRARRIYADDEVEVQENDQLLFEVSDVVDLLTEVTGEAVEANTDEPGVVEFTVGEETYTVDTSDEVMECVRLVRNTRPVRASSMSRRTNMPIRSSSSVSNRRRTGVRRPASRYHR